MITQTDVLATANPCAARSPAIAVNLPSCLQLCAPQVSLSVERVLKLALNMLDAFDAGDYVDCLDFQMVRAQLKLLQLNVG